MLVNQEILESLCKDAGEERTRKAIDYKNCGKVQRIDCEYKDSNNFSVSSVVVGTKPYKTYILIQNGEVQDITCNCEDYYHHYGVCKHTLASVMVFSEDPVSIKKEDRELFSDASQYRSFKQIVNTFYNEEINQIDYEEEKTTKNKGTVKIEPKIMYDKFSGNMKIEFKIGNKKMYKIKDLSEFYTNMLEKKFYKYGEKLQFVHTKEVFEEESQPLLDFILKYAEIIKYTNSNANSNYRYYGKALSETSILIGNSGMDDIFEILKGKKVTFQKDCNIEEIEFTEEQPKIEFKLKKMKEGQYSIVPNIEIFEVIIIKGKDYKYVWNQKTMHRCTKEFENTSLKLLEIFRQNYRKEVMLGKDELTDLFSVIIPKVKNAIVLENIVEEEIEQYRPKQLEVKVFLDFNENDFLIAEVKFAYEENEFNPLDESLKLNFPRNRIQETKALNIFRKTGFMLDSKNLRLILPENDKIYRFLTEDINYYMHEFDVLATEKFKTRQVRQPKIGSLGVKVENDLLSIDLKSIEIDTKELKQIMDKYALKKKYHRLKDGSFLNLEENQEIDFLNKLITRNGYRL